MATSPISDEVVGRIKALLDMNYSVTMVVKELQRQHVDVSRATVGRVKNGTHRATNNNNQNTPRRKTFKVLNRRKLNQLDKMTKNPDPPTHRHLANIFGCTQPNINYHINNTLNKKKRMRPKVHKLNVEQK
jgi:hypothetical protein